MKALWIEYSEYSILEDSQGQAWMDLTCWINPAGLDSRRITLMPKEKDDGNRRAAAEAEAVAKEKKAEGL